MEHYKNWWLQTADGRVVVGQPPNLPLVLVFISIVASVSLSAPWQSISMAAAAVFLSWWAILEITQGVNRFRRLLGALTLLAVIITAIWILTYA